MRLSVASGIFLVLLSSILVPPSALGVSINDSFELDSAGLADLEARAEHAQPNEQAYLFTQLVSDYVDVAGKQVAAGEMDEATASLQHIQSFADRIHAGLGKNSKRIKNAEMLMHMATYKLTQLMHFISTEDSTMLQATLKRLDKLHDELLQQVFAH